MELNEDRNWIIALLLTIITFGIYGLYLVYVMARDTNTACSNVDHQTTMGLLVYILLDIITSGIFSIIWTVLIILRWENFAKLAGEKPKCTVGSFLLWSIVGSLIIIGPIVAFAKYINGFNQCCALYNGSRKKNL